MKIRRALGFGVLGALAISVLSALLRAAHVPIDLELILGTLTGLGPGPLASGVGLLVHLAIGAAFGLLYGFLFERVWNHGGAATGMILGVLHAALIGMVLGLTPRFHPLIPSVLPSPGPYFANLGPLGVVAFFAVHVLYGAIVGRGYGHVAAERGWAPAGRL
jgi:hypothetical protein